MDTDQQAGRKSVGRKFSDDVLRKGAALTEVVSYIERVGVCVAALLGGAAIMKFRELLLPGAAWLPAVVGMLVVFGSLLLTVWIAIDGYVRVYTGNSKIIGMAIYLFLIVPSIFFAIGGLYAGIKGLTP